MKFSKLFDTIGKLESGSSSNSGKLVLKTTNKLRFFPFVKVTCYYELEPEHVACLNAFYEDGAENGI